MTTPKRSYTPWSFTIKTLPRTVYDIVRSMKTDHALTNWQTIIIAVLSLSRIQREHPQKFLEVVQWVKTTYPDGKVESEGPFGT